MQKRKCANVTNVERRASSNNVPRCSTERNCDPTKGSRASPHVDPSRWHPPWHARVSFVDALVRWFHPRGAIPSFNTQWFRSFVSILECRRHPHTSTSPSCLVFHHLSHKAPLEPDISDSHMDRRSLAIFTVFPFPVPIEGESSGFEREV